MVSNVRDILENLDIQIDREELLNTFMSEINQMVYDRENESLTQNVDIYNRIVLDETAVKIHKDIFDVYDNLYVIPYDIQSVMHNIDYNINSIVYSQDITANMQKAIECQMMKYFLGLESLDKDTLISNYVFNQLTAGEYYSSLIKAIFKYREKGIGLYFKLNMYDSNNESEVINITLHNTADSILIKAIEIVNPIMRTTPVEDVMLSIIDKIFLFEPDIFLPSLVGRMVNGDIKLEYSYSKAMYIHPYLLPNDKLLHDDKDNRKYINDAYRLTVKDMNNNTLLGIDRGNAKYEEILLTSHTGMPLINKQSGILYDYRGVNLNITEGEFLNNIQK